MQINFKKLLIIFFFLNLPIETIAEEIFLSLKKNKVNVRYGPSFESPVKYIYKKVNLPIKQIDKKENWRRIIDFKNNSGWIHWSQLKKINSIIPLEDKILFKKPSYFSKPLAKIKKGRVLIVQKCAGIWCKIKSENFNGWVKTDNIWGSVN
jgi:SH3-like domain-containing protein